MKKDYMKMNRIYGVIVTVYSNTDGLLTTSVYGPYSYLRSVGKFKSLVRKTFPDIDHDELHDMAYNKGFLERENQSSCDSDKPEEVLTTFISITPISP